MKPGIMVVMVMLTMGSTWHTARADVHTAPGASMRLIPRAATFDIDKVPQGAVGFTASISNEGPTAIAIAHPSICFPPARRHGETGHFHDSHGKSEILLRITKPDGAAVTLRDGYLHYFDPENVPLITIPRNGTGTFDVGWFFPNARGRWEQDDEAARLFLMKGTYKIRMLLRNVFPKAALYDEDARKRTLIDVWTGEMESPEVVIEVK